MLDRLPIRELKTADHHLRCLKAGEEAKAAGHTVRSCSAEKKDPQLYRVHRRRFSKTPRPPLRHSPPEGSQESGNAHHVAKPQTDDAACSPPRRDRRQALRVRDAPIARAVPHSSHSPILPVLTSTNLRACTLPDTCKPTALAETTGVSQNTREKGNVAGRTRCGRDRVDRYLRPLRARPGGSISATGLRPVQ